MTDKAQGEREQFENWCGSGRYRFVALQRMSGDRYVHPGVEADWHVWQASRAALKAQPAPTEAARGNDSARLDAPKSFESTRSMK